MVVEKRKRLCASEIAKILNKIRSRFAAASMDSHGQDWADLFRRMDKNHDGTLDFTEVRLMFRRVLRIRQDDISDQQLHVLFEELDHDHSGEISLEELRYLLAEGHVDEIVSHIQQRWNRKEARPGDPDPLQPAPPTQAEVEEAHELFQLFDEDYSGTIDSKEMIHCLQGLGFNPSHAECANLVGRLPPEGADFDMFFELAREQSKVLHHEDDDQALLQAFKVFDTDNRGWLSITEVRFIMQKYGEPLSEEELEDMVNRLDGDGDGVITLEEAVKGKLFQNDPLEDLHAQRMQEVRQAAAQALR